MCNCWHVSITWWIHNIIHNWCPSHGLTTMYSDEHNVSIHMHWMHLIPPLSSLQLWQARPLQCLWQGSLHPLPHYIVECVWIRTSLRFRCMTLCGHTKWDNFTLRKKQILKFVHIFTNMNAWLLLVVWHSWATKWYMVSPSFQEMGLCEGSKWIKPKG